MGRGEAVVLLSLRRVAAADAAAARTDSGALVLAEDLGFALIGTYMKMVRR